MTTRNLPSVPVHLSAPADAAGDARPLWRRYRIALAVIAVAGVLIVTLPEGFWRWAVIGVALGAAIYFQRTCYRLQATLGPGICPKCQHESEAPGLLCKACDVDVRR